MPTPIKLKNSRPPYREITVDRNNVTIDTIKQKIQKEFQIPIESQKLVHMGKEVTELQGLQVAKDLESGNDVIHIVVKTNNKSNNKPKGGAKRKPAKRKPTKHKPAKRKPTGKKKVRKIHKGPRGGRYYISKGRKVYI